MTTNKPPLVLFHGITSSGPTAWRSTLPYLAAQHQVYAPTVFGHRGGAVRPQNRVSIFDVVDDAERYLDRQGLERAHLAGNSMGGFVALELARRGRAITVCALSPGGFWSPDNKLRQKVMRRIRPQAAMLRRVRPVVNSALGLAPLRRVAMHDIAHHPERMTAAFARETVNDVAACTVVNDLFSSDAEYVSPMDPVPCPITIVWAEHDRLLPLADYEAVVRQRIPGARFEVLPGVGHVPMVDDPALVARAILASAQ